ncbi:hypothetical protein VTJ04DRAFT_135 [Mycothermus thermophilus]|uniref:uncharacterized protein n=1 Tax=Humicola insolens TaxID=85995 RepID=UPI00374218C9
MLATQSLNLASKRLCPFSDDMTQTKRQRPTVSPGSRPPENRTVGDQALSICQDSWSHPRNAMYPSTLIQQPTSSVTTTRVVELDANEEPGEYQISINPSSFTGSTGYGFSSETDSTGVGHEEATDNHDTSSDSDVTSWVHPTIDLDDTADPNFVGNLSSWTFSQTLGPVELPTLASSAADVATGHLQETHLSEDWDGQHDEASYLAFSSSLVSSTHWEVVQGDGARPPDMQHSSRPASANAQPTSSVPEASPGTSRQIPSPKEEGDSIQFVVYDPSTKMESSPRRRGPFQDPARQEETSRTRQLKACVRCQNQRIRCRPDPENPSGTCLTCRDVSKPTLHSLRCLRYRLTECTLYRTGKAPGLEFTYRWREMRLKDITDWESPDIRTIEVMSDVCDEPLKLLVRKFKPIPQDSITKSWWDKTAGIRRYKKTTPYAIVNMKKTVDDMLSYIAKYALKSVVYVLRRSDQLVKETYAFAARYRPDAKEERDLLENFFLFWFAIRRTATTEHISGPDKLDMEPGTEEESYPLPGTVPLPPVMIQQLDMILTLGVLQPLKKRVLEDLQKLAQTANPKNWMTIYLVTFMLLHSCALITDENYKNARKHGLVRRYAMPNFISEHHHSANVILSHYHYRTESCNPFKQDWRQRHRTPFAHLSPQDIQFLERTKDLLKEKQREDRIRRNREFNLYEDELYFAGQMYEEKWSPRDTEIEYTDEKVKIYVGQPDGSKGQ